MKKSIKLIILIAILSLTFSYCTFAGSINGNEQRVISVASGTFDYNGKKYVASSAYVALLTAKLSEDGVDMTAQQADAAIQQIYANVASAVQQGYLVSATDSTSAQEASQNTNENEKQTNANKVNSNAQQTEKGNGSNITEGKKNSEQNKDTNKSSDNEISMNDLIKDQKNQEKTNSSQTEKNEITQHEDLDEEDITLKSPADSSRNKKEEHADKNRKYIGFAVSVIAILVVAGVFIFLIIRKIKNKSLLKTSKAMKYDIHSHILPGVDDGSKNMQMSIQMIEEAYRQGIRYMVATPHYTPGEKNPSVEHLEKVHKELCEEVVKRNLNVKIGLGNEVLYSPSVIQDLEEHKIHLMPEEFTKMKGNVVLVEFSPKDDYKTIYEAVKKLVSNMYTPIIAHVERYENINSREKYNELKEAGAKFQINVRTLKKAGNKQFVKRAHQLIRDGLVDYLGTDAHNVTSRTVDTREMVGFIEKYSNDEDKRKLLDNEKKQA